MVVLWFIGIRPAAGVPSSRCIWVTSVCSRLGSVELCVPAGSPVPISSGLTVPFSMPLYFSLAEAGRP
jgi:hypothetical protein